MLGPSGKKRRRNRDAEDETSAGSNALHGADPHESGPNLPPPTPTERAAPLPPLAGGTPLSTDRSAADIEADERRAFTPSESSAGKFFKGPTATLHPKAGWYPDPEDETRHRWWEGQRWTDHVS